MSSLIFCIKHYQVPFLLNKINYPLFYFLDLLVYLLEHPLTPASGILPTKQQHNRYFVNTPFILSTHQCLSLLIAFNTLFLSRFLLFPLFCGHNTSVMRAYKCGRPIVWVLSVLEFDSRMPGHDHSLRKLYTIEGLSNPSMVYNWICPVMPKEECPYEALARIFSKYFTDTNRINSNEDYLNFGWAASLFTESDWSTMKHHAKKMHL